MIPDVYRPCPKYPTYPPYHEGLYLEDYFYEWSKNKSFNRIYIPIFWTTLYCDNHPINIQHVLNRLDPNKKYFTVCQHDDAPRERLPKDTLVFSAGGNVINEQTVAIPLICSEIKNPNPAQQKQFFCSFIGSVTHPIREKMISCLKGKNDYVLSYQNWTPSVQSKQFEHFKTVTENSVFCLCPRGYGKSSFRLYEAMQLGAIPVYISDHHYLPWTDELDWNSFSVLVKENEIQNIDQILKSISQQEIISKQNKINELYKKYFNLNGICNQIMKRVNE